jgi:hypothetical protein
VRELELGLGLLESGACLLDLLGFSHSLGELSPHLLKRLPLSLKLGLNLGETRPSA